MPPSLDRPTLDRLIAKGREQGFLTTADLRGALPIAAMSPDDIALTRRVGALMKSVDILLLDHLIVGGRDIVSMRERGLL